jgi:hypothetical protein
VVRGLKRLDGQPTGEGVDLLDVEVRRSDVPDLALLDELLERARRFRERDIRIGPVDLVEVDVVELERAQALLHPLAQPLAT